jgi:hypothetical protein
MTENTIRYAHICPADALKVAYETSEPAKSFCGEDWAPVTSDVELELCPVCKEMYRGIYGVGFDS